MQCARLGSFSGKVGPGGPQMGDRSERAVGGVASACISYFFWFFGTLYIHTKGPGTRKT